METRERAPAAGGGFGVNPSNRIIEILGLQGAIFPDDPYDRSLSITPGREYVSKLKDWGLSGEINYDFGSAKLTSITAYRQYKAKDSGDYDYNAADLLYRDPGTFRQFKTFTQELRLQGSAFGGMVDWLVEIEVIRSFPELPLRSEEHTSELQSLMRISYAVFCLKKKKT